MTVEEYYETIWCDDDEKEDDNQFYKNWLEASGKYDIVVQPWETTTLADNNNSNNGGRPSGGRGGWDQDTTQYVQQRQVDFTFTRTTHL